MQKVRNLNWRALVIAVVILIVLVALVYGFTTGNLKASMAGLDATTLLTIVFALSTFSLIISIYVNIFLLRWRKAVSGSDVSIVPSELLAILEGQKVALNKNTGQQTDLINRLSSDLGKIFQHLQRDISTGVSASRELLDAFSGLQAELDSKDKEIRRLRNGYDAEIFKRFVVRFLRVEKVIGEELEDASEGNEELKSILGQLRILMSDAFMDCGLERFDLEVGANIREVEGVDENYKTVTTEQPDQVLTIAETIESGWRITTPQGYDYVRNARVAVFVAPTEHQGS
jgi:hypothetical protein